MMKGAKRNDIFVADLLAQTAALCKAQVVGV